MLALARVAPSNVRVEVVAVRRCARHVVAASVDQRGTAYEAPRNLSHGYSYLAPHGGEASIRGDRRPRN
jgi:hypothetical protein